MCEFIINVMKLVQHYDDMKLSLEFLTFFPAWQVFYGLTFVNKRWLNRV